MVDVLNKLIDNLPSILVALTGVLVAWNNLSKKLDAVAVDAKTGMAETVAGNATLDRVHEMIATATTTPAGPTEVRVVNAPSDPVPISVEPANETPEKVEPRS